MLILFEYEYGMIGLRARNSYTRLIDGLTDEQNLIYTYKNEKKNTKNIRNALPEKGLTKSDKSQTRQ